MITTFLVKEGVFNQIESKNINNINIDEIEKEGLLWLDLFCPTDEEISILTDKFSFHELSIEDCIFPQNNPKLDKFDMYAFMIFHDIKYENGEVSFKELNIFISNNFIITVHEDELKCISNVINKCKQGVNFLTLTKSVDFLLHSIIDNMVDNYLPTLEKIEDEITQLEEEIISNPQRSYISKIFTLKKSLFTLRKIIIPQMRIIRQLCLREIPYIRRSTVIYFKDIYDNLNRIGSMINTYLDNVMTMLEVYLAGVTSKTNEAVKRLTLLGTIGLVPVFVASYYGMNVIFPEQSLGKFALPIIVFIMITLTTALVFLLKKIKWI